MKSDFRIYLQYFDQDLTNHRIGVVLGAGYGGGLGSSSLGSLGANISSLAKKYPLSSSGKFGTKGTGNSRVIESSNPAATAKEFFSKLGSGGRVSKLSNGKGEVAKFPDGSRVNFRPKSGSGSPAVDISISGPKGTHYKIHFEKTKSSKED